MSDNFQARRNADDSSVFSGKTNNSEDDKAKGSGVDVSTKGAGQQVDAATKTSGTSVDNSGKDAASVVDSQPKGSNVDADTKSVKVAAMVVDSEVKPVKMDTATKLPVSTDSQTKGSGITTVDAQTKSNASAISEARELQVEENGSEELFENLISLDNVEEALKVLSDQISNSNLSEEEIDDLEDIMDSVNSYLDNFSDLRRDIVAKYRALAEVLNARTIEGVNKKVEFMRGILGE